MNHFTKDKESFLNELGFGAAITTGNQQGTGVSDNITRLASYKTAAQNNFFSFRDSVIANGKRTRIVPQAYLYTDSVFWASML